MVKQIPFLNRQNKEQQNCHSAASPSALLQYSQKTLLLALNPASLPAPALVLTLVYSLLSSLKATPASASTWLTGNSCSAISASFAPVLLPLLLPATRIISSTVDL